MRIGNFFLGILIAAYGVVSLKYNYRYTNLFSRSDFIESWFGSMFTFVKLTSIFAVLIGLLIAVGLGDNFADFITKPLQKAFGN